MFNTTCLIGPEGILYKYRKVNPWIPFEVHASPHDIEGYEEQLFPVAKTQIGNIGCAICYDWLFPEAIRQLAANGAEVLVRVSAYMDPWGATEPMDWWTMVNRCRALENMVFVVAANQGASLSTTRRTRGRAAARSSTSTAEFWRRPPRGPANGSSWPRSTCARCGTSARPAGHHMLAHLRTEAYPVYSKHIYPPRTKAVAAARSVIRTESGANRSGEVNGLDDADARIQNPEHRMQNGYQAASKHRE